MIDPSIGIAGLALALLFGVLQYYVPQFPSWAAYAGGLVGVFLLGASAGLLMTHKGSARKLAPARSALLRLHVYADHRVPEVMQWENIFRWYYLRQSLVTLGSDGTQTAVFPTTTLFVTFEPEVQILTLKVRSPNLTLPSHEVKEFNQRFAIIVFAGNLNEGTLEIAVQP